MIRAIAPAPHAHTHNISVLSTLLTWLDIAASYETTKHWKVVCYSILFACTICRRCCSAWACCGVISNTFCAYVTDAILSGDWDTRKVQIFLYMINNSLATTVTNDSFIEAIMPNEGYASSLSFSLNKFVIVLAFKIGLNVVCNEWHYIFILYIFFCFE